MPIVTEAPHVFKVGSYSAEKLRVLRFEGSEGLSEIFHFSLDLASTDQKIEFDQVVGQTALLTVRGSEGTRHVHGLVNLFEQTGKNGKWTLYRAEFVPAIWKLGLRATCRIFQEKTIPDILKQVLLDAGLTTKQFRFALDMGRYKARTYCVQYAETDLNFISRLMEQYGIWYYFEHSDSNHVLVMGDDPSSYATPSGTSSILYHAPSTAGVPSEEHISQFRYQTQIRRGAVKLKDFDFEKPALKVTGDAQAKTDGKLEAYDYLGECWGGSDRTSLANVRLEEAQALRQVGSGQSDCCRLVPGYRFTLDQYHRTDLNREYLTVTVTHKGNQRQVLGAEAGGQIADDAPYGNEFQCIPSDVPFRSACRAPRPRIEGPQTAIVVGPSGEDIYTDKYGRVKVQFHWDREGADDEKSSSWIRVSQVHAGKGFGSVDIPRIGEEVVVGFLDGDPDRPIIIGRVYNAHNMPPNGLPDAGMVSGLKSNSTPGGGGNNCMMMDDRKGKEAITIHGQHNMSTTVKNDHSITVTSGNDTHTVSAGTRSVTVKGKTSLTVQAGDRVVNVTGNYKCDTTSEINLQAPTKITLTCGGSTITMEPGKIVLKAGGGASVTLDGDALMVSSGGSEVRLNANVNAKSSGGSSVTLDGNAKMSGAAEATVEGATKSTLSGGGSTVVNDPAGVAVTGVKISLNG